MTRDDVIFRYYRGESKCPEGTPMNYWSCEKYIASQSESFFSDKHEDFVRMRDSGEFARDCGEWLNEMAFLNKAIGNGMSEADVFSGFCVRSVDDFSGPECYDDYFSAEPVRS